MLGFLKAFEEMLRGAMKRRAIIVLITLFMVVFWGLAFAQPSLQKGDKAYKKGNYETALRYYKRSLDINRKINNPEGISKTLEKIGLIYVRNGKYDEAFKCHNEGLEIARWYRFPREISKHLNRIGDIYRILAYYDKALKFYDEGLKTARKSQISFWIGENLLGMGILQSDLGHWEEALRYLEEALVIFGEMKNEWEMVKTLNQIGSVQRQLGQYDEALKYLEEALEINRKLKIQLEIFNNLTNIGRVHLLLGNYNMAEKLFLEAQKERPKIKGPYINLDLIEVYIATERYKDALGLLGEKPNWLDSSTPWNRFHTLKGYALKGVGELGSASYEFLKAVSSLEAMRNKVSSDRISFFESGFQGGRIKAYQGLVTSLSERAVAGENEDIKFISYGKDLRSAAFYFSECTKARTLLEGIVEVKKGGNIVEIPRDLREKEENLNRSLSAIERSLETAHVKGERKSFQKLTQKKENFILELDGLVKEFREKYPRYSLLNYPNPIAAQNLPLRDNEILFEYALGKDESYVFVVRKGGVETIVKIPIARKTLEEKVKVFIEPLQTKQFLGFSIKEGKELYDILLANALKNVKEQEKLIIITEGILGLLPFEALVMEDGLGAEGSVFVGDRFDLRYYQSASVLAFQRTLQGEKPEKVLFALGNPVFSKEDPRYVAWKDGKKEPKEQVIVAGLDKYSFRALATGRGVKLMGRDLQNKELEYKPLPETEEEVVEIARTMGVEPTPPDVLLSVMANETQLRKAKLDQYRYIHFATHADLPGEVQGINEPFILLGQVENGEGDDGFLTLSEVLGMRLNAELVVLSACLTGRGKLMEGEGVINFSRAFQHAGAQSVLVSLWEAPSAETVIFMKIFYAHLNAGKSRQEALTLARKDMKAKYPNPFFWAVFVLHGEG